MQIKKLFHGHLITVSVFVICLLAGFIFMSYDRLPLFTAFAGENESVDDEDNLDVIVINNDVYEKDRRGPVIFPHLKHAKDDKLLCWECHHEYDDGGNNIYVPWNSTLACADCHDPDEKVDNVVKLQTAYHLSCKNCHEKMKIYGDEPFAYRKCNRCHEREE